MQVAIDSMRTQTANVFVQTIGKEEKREHNFINNQLLQLFLDFIVVSTDTSEKHRALSYKVTG